MAKRENLSTNKTMRPQKKQLAILGSTGSIGTQTLSVVRSLGNAVEVVGLSAGTNVSLLAKQIREWKPRHVSVATEDAAEKLIITLQKARYTPLPNIKIGDAGHCHVASRPNVDLVIAGMVGAVGLTPTLAALKAGHDVATANKETLVVAGALIMKEARKAGAHVFPVDSEHNALFQALEGNNLDEVRMLHICATGGPFRKTPINKMLNASVEAALNHPIWSMGRKITIDSATMMNKGLEIIEARWLFDMPREKIKPVIHPQGIVHSMVEYHDGSIIAQMAVPDMKLPIAHAITYPRRMPGAVKSLGLTSIPPLTFEEVDTKRYPAVKLAQQALKEGGSMPAVLNAANEIAVAAFLDKKIRFGGITDLVAATMRAHEVNSARTLRQALNADAWARTKAAQLLGTKRFRH